MPPIRVAPGTFAGGTRFMDIAMPMAAQALAGIFQGKRLGEQETYERQQKAEEIKRQQDALRRQQAVSSIAQLIDIHGPDAVNMPEFKEYYKQVFGRDYPTVPEMQEEVVTPAQPGRPGTPSQVVPIPSITSPAERGPGGAQRPEAPSEVVIPGERPTPPTRAVTRQVPTGRQVPTPMGGRDAQWLQMTPRQLGMEGLVPPQLLDAPIRVLKTMGYDIDSAFKGAKAASSDSVVAEALLALQEGRATPGHMAVLSLKYGGEGAAKTPQAWAIQQLNAVEGDMQKLAQVNPYAAQVLLKEIQDKSSSNALFNVRARDNSVIPVKGMDDLKALIAGGLIDIKDLPDVAKRMLRLDEEAGSKGVPAGTVNSAINAAGEEAAKILGIYTIAGAWLWPDDAKEKEAKQKEWADLRDKIFRQRMSTLRTETGAAAPVESADPDKTASPLHPSMQWLVNNPRVGNIPFTVRSTTGDQHVPGSNHYKGLAVDITPDIPVNQWDKVIKDLQKQGFFVNDERTRPSGAAGQYWTGPHLHVQPGATLMKQGLPLDSPTRNNIVEDAKKGVPWSDIEAGLHKAGFSSQAVESARRVYGAIVKGLPPTKDTTKNTKTPGKPQFNPFITRILGIPPEKTR